MQFAISFTDVLYIVFKKDLTQVAGILLNSKAYNVI